MNKNIRRFLSRYMVPILFIIICGAGIIIAKPPLSYLTGELARRMVRNSFLVLSLIIPILAGMGINFGIPLGAMAGQIGLIFVTDWGVTGVAGIMLAALVGTPIAILLGNFSGRIMNRARGREMITSMILSFFTLGLYMLFLLYFCGSLIPFRNKKIILSQGYGIKNALKLDVAKGLDNLLNFKVNFAIMGEKVVFEIPVVTILVIAVLCVFIIWFKKTKIGHDMRAVGQDQKVSGNAGLNTDKIRIQSIVISTVLACYGQIIYLQNIGTLNTYAGQDQAALYAAASLLVGGASVSKASIPNAIFGTALFHLMFIVMPQAGKALTGDAMIGEYFRTFLSYGVVTIALIMHAYERQKEIEENRILSRASANRQKVKAKAE
ncbi:simple sugar transport system permease protein [Anaerosphaera aminiphila DSM 21120]|uniref:Simple sugar transport system permease protein n=1 Tax=Anaerosphaera aminiphila DSM 21120 TaxID=1120995 RepID=A0A1M5QEH0_9FIRM|nr:ABC transporter permease [Anaerosphaera aminiphila]SHH12250.1 simple sugar transport system permease protein [Anaerosphaera aminiphila DSM 21120]